MCALQWDRCPATPKHPLDFMACLRPCYPRRLLSHGAATTVVSPTIPSESYQAGEDCQGILSWLPGSQLHSPASPHPQDGSLSSRLCEPSVPLKFTLSRLSYSLQISWICPLLQEVGTCSTLMSTIILETFKVHAEPLSIPEASMH